MLRSLSLAAYLDPGRTVPSPNGRIRLVAMLTSRARSAHGLDVDVALSKRDVGSRRLREHCDRYRARVHATALFVVGYALPPVTARLGREQRRSAAARDHE